MKPTILFPFSVNTDFREGLIWAEELAQRMLGTLILFTAIAQPTEEQVVRVYEAVLRAQGHPSRLKRQPPRVRPSIRIETGSLPDAIRDHLQANLVDILVLDPHLPAAIAQLETQLVQAANSTILLQADGGAPSPSRSFFARLQQAKIHKLPDHVYQTLSNDPGFFNLVRAMFRR